MEPDDIKPSGIYFLNPGSSHEHYGVSVVLPFISGSDTSCLSERHLPLLRMLAATSGGRVWAELADAVEQHGRLQVEVLGSPTVGPSTMTATEYAEAQRVFEAVSDQIVFGDTEQSRRFSAALVDSFRRLRKGHGVENP